MAQRYEYKVETIRSSLVGDKIDSDGLEKELNEEAGDGWQLQSGSGWLLVACARTGEAQRAEVKQHGARIAAALRESVRFRESFA